MYIIHNIYAKIKMSLLLLLLFFILIIKYFYFVVVIVGIFFEKKNVEKPLFKIIYNLMMMMI